MRIELYLSDAVEFLETRGNETVDLVLTDPPYNVSRKGSKLVTIDNGVKRYISLDFGEWDYNYDPSLFLAHVPRILNQFGSLIVWTSEELYGVYRKWAGENMCPKQMLVWEKTNPIPQFRKTAYRQATEIAMWASKTNKMGNNFTFGRQEDMKNIWKHPITGGKERISDENGVRHPSQKPLSIVQAHVTTHCRADGLVVDPYAGTATTAIACLRTGRNFSGCEISEKYYNMAVARIRSEIDRVECDIEFITS